MALYVAALDYGFNPNTAQLCGSVIIQNNVQWTLQLC